MSQYIQFFIRSEDKFIPLCSFSRSNIIYKVFGYDVPYGNIIPLTESILHVADGYLTSEEDAIKVRIKKQQDLIESIHHFDNTVDDKLEAIHSVTETIGELEYELEPIDRARHLVDFFEAILTEAKYRDSDCPLTDYTENTVLYAGIEVSAYPTMNDILKGE